MNAAETETQWFIARDGRQHGPLTDLEMRTFVSHQYLRPTDLIWKVGFRDWEPATTIFPSAFDPTLAPYQGMPVAPAAKPADVQPQLQSTQESYIPTADQAYDSPFVSQADESLKAYNAERRKRTMVASLVFGAIAVAGAGVISYRGPISAMFASGPAGSADTPVVRSTPGGEAVPASGADQSPATTAALTPDAPPAAPQSDIDALDARLQKIPVWALIKEQFPDWYTQRVATAAAAVASSDGTSNVALARALAEGLVKLRRSNSEKALASSPDSLKRIATAFLDNLKALRTRSVNACYGFISKGETSPAILEILQEPETATELNAQSEAIFKAIAEGTKAPVTHERAQRPDYDQLIQELNKLGWKDEDLQIFSNPRQLAQRPPERVCQMVQDWFSAHLALSDAGVQERLLVETLRPVVSG